MIDRPVSMNNYIREIQTFEGLPFISVDVCATGA
jgi:hypothetical protein